jgi:glucoamylase
VRGVALLVGSALALAASPAGARAADGIATSTTVGSHVWAALANGGVSQVDWPGIDRPQIRDLELVVGDGKTFAERERDATVHRIELADPRSLEYTQVDTAASGRYRIFETTITDPFRNVLLVDVRLESLVGGPYRAYVYLDPSLGGTAGGDSGRTDGDALLASDGARASALVCSCGFARSTSGAAGTATDPLPDLLADGRLDRTGAASAAGDLVQLADTGGAGSFTLALGFGRTEAEALAAARGSLRDRFPDLSLAYEVGWHQYLAGLARARLSTGLLEPYRIALMTLRASEDKTVRGATVASLAGAAAGRLVRPRDLYAVGTAELAVGDRRAATRALDRMLALQRPDGTLPPAATVAGRVAARGLELDETAFPLLLAWQLGRDDGATWRRFLRRAADAIVARGPATPRDRWGEAAGYAPATLAAEIAGLVCAADLARANGDLASEGLYLGVADAWHRRLAGWTYTTTGPLAPHFERIDRDGHPNDGQSLRLAGGAAAYDERAVLDPGFLELVRLGVLPARNARVRSSVAAVDASLEVTTPSGPGWYRYSHDAAGEGGVGRLWPVLTGERGEFELARGRSAVGYLRTMAAMANEGGLVPEQVWDRPGAAGAASGEGTGPATPQVWGAAQLVRLARDVQARRLLDRPAVVAGRYARGGLRAGPALHVRRTGGVVAGATTARLVVVARGRSRVAVRLRTPSFRLPLPFGPVRAPVTVVAVGARSTSLVRLRPGH